MSNLSNIERKMEGGSSGRQGQISQNYLLCLKLLRPVGNLEYYLFPFRFSCCGMYYLQYIYVGVTMVTLSTVYFLMLTNSSLHDTYEETQYALRYPSVSVKSHLQGVHGHAKVLFLRRY